MIDRLNYLQLALPASVPLKVCCMQSVGLLREGSTPRTSGDRALAWDWRLKMALFLGSSSWDIGS